MGAEAHRYPLFLLSLLLYPISNIYCFYYIGIMEKKCYNGSCIILLGSLEVQFAIHGLL